MLEIMVDQLVGELTGDDIKILEDISGFNQVRMRDQISKGLGMQGKFYYSGDDYYYFKNVRLNFSDDLNFNGFNSEDTAVFMETVIVTPNSINYYKEFIPWNIKFTELNESHYHKRVEMILGKTKEKSDPLITYYVMRVGEVIDRTLIIVGSLKFRLTLLGHLTNKSDENN